MCIVLAIVEMAFIDCKRLKNGQIVAKYHSVTNSKSVIKEG